jgi:hypothetical protein
MAVSARLEQLSSKHITLDMQIQQELRSPLPDTLRISDLKKQKLQIKDTIKDFGESAST